MMSTNAGPYDTSRMYRSGSHVMKDDEPDASPKAPVLEIERATAPEMPPDQRAAVDMLRQEIRTLVGGLRLIAAAKARSHRIE
jgi:hypothetical protein